MISSCLNCVRIGLRVHARFIGGRNAISQLDAFSTDAHKPEAETLTNDRLKGPPLEHFIANSTTQRTNNQIEGEESTPAVVPYLNTDAISGNNRKVYFETYGCQMNVNDTEIAWAILQKAGFHKASDINEADVIFAVTCSIRDKAEQKIWSRLKYYQSLKNKRSTKDKEKPPIKVGLLGCMAERLKKEVLEQSRTVDLVAGPDSYRDLPRLLSVAADGQTAINVLLSMEETYADVVPVRLNASAKSAFVSIMRGCDNMCSYCIVPFTRGRERSRPVSSILEEVRVLSDQGVKEVTLLGQNVNSYRDLSQTRHHIQPQQPTDTSRGFKTIYKPKVGGLRFADLLDRVSLVDPEMRVRFTSPHPKDFPDQVLEMIKERANICNHLHMPAQTGSTSVLERMRRGYSREAYLELVDRVRALLPGVSITSDFIAGFCGETEEEHRDTISLMERVQYNYAYMFAYSMRKKTHAYHKMKDDVPEEVKKRRLQEIIKVFREGAEKLNANQVGEEHLVLIKGVSKRGESHVVGRNDGHTRVILPNCEVPIEGENPSGGRLLQAGDYVLAKITGSNAELLKGQPLFHTTLQQHARKLPGQRDHVRSEAGT